MNIQRAQEITQSGEIPNIIFNGKRVYIQHVDPDKKTARIYPLDDPEKEQEVSVTDLIEH
ncbi:H-type small acid-soluble spore protein [Lysinibacillus endophyticus]|uniref:H-type small acid-soluble spore protein n=1 Tax=Ureibacillus endophyticus TaxID=1978490 RepID=UPI0020A11C0F|nr:H-type small acid-soluble spore protein [Lysinibacillus endophyticus]MCP1145002.1 H-type small acid-soluble spore protein [Lysinibacillus endophyticus]